MNGQPKIWREVGHRVGATLCGRGFCVSVSAQLPCLLGLGVVAALAYWLGAAPGWIIPMLAGVLLGSVEIVVAKEQERGES